MTDKISRAEAKMADTELIRHQQMWKSFTTAVKFAVGGIGLLLVVLDLTLIR